MQGWNEKLAKIQADNGGEYHGPFETYCKLHGIIKKTPPKTLQLNGLAERMNRTIEERVRCILSHAKLHKSLWGEAMKTIVDIINLSPSVLLDGDVLKEVWSGRKVTYNHLKVFGCQAFVHIPKDERGKLDLKAKECIQDMNLATNSGIWQIERLLEVEMLYSLRTKP